MTKYLKFLTTLIINCKSYWKHNNSLLSDIDYINQINEKILEELLEKNI